MVVGMTERPQKNKIVLIVVLAIVLAAVMAWQFGLLPPGSGKGGSAVVPSPGGGASGTVTPGSAGAQTPPAIAQMAWKRPDAVGPVARDPMHMDLAKQLPAQGPEASDESPKGTEFSVTGIIYSANQPSSAIIDGRILREGDTIYGAAISRINEDSVEFTIGDKKWTVKAGERTVTEE
jgi:hypothetical protein